MSDVRVFHCLSASQSIIDRAAVQKHDVLQQLYADAIKEVADQVREQGLKPLSDVLCFVSVEQWCEKP